MYKLAIITPFYKNIESDVGQCFVNEFSAIGDKTLKIIQLISIDGCLSKPINKIVKKLGLNFKLHKVI